jgi:hypothetical protein
LLFFSIVNAGERPLSERVGFLAVMKRFAREPSEASESIETNFAEAE